MNTTVYSKPYEDASIMPSGIPKTQAADYNTRLSQLLKLDGYPTVLISFLATVFPFLEV